MPVVTIWHCHFAPKAPELIPAPVAVSVRHRVPVWTPLLLVLHRCKPLVALRRVLIGLDPPGYIGRRLCAVHHSEAHGSRTPTIAAALPWGRAIAVLASRSRRGATVLLAPATTAAPPAPALCRRILWRCPPIGSSVRQLDFLSDAERFLQRFWISHF
jgi:hypothetical protein